MTVQRASLLYVVIYVLAALISRFAAALCGDCHAGSFIGFTAAFLWGLVELLDTVAQKTGLVGLIVVLKKLASVWETLSTSPAMCCLV